MAYYWFDLICNVCKEEYFADGTSIADIYARKEHICPHCQADDHTVIESGKELD